MKRAFSSYTPRVKRVDYDSLSLDIGCQDLNAGTDLFATKAFSRVCIFEHDETSFLFNQPGTVSYCYGPANTGDGLPWLTRWAANVRPQGGIVVQKKSRVDLPNTTGTLSSLFKTESPSKISLGFMPNGQMAIAIQKTDSAIQIKWFKDDTGAVETIGDVSFPGVSPVLFNNGLVYYSDDADETDLVLFYVIPTQKRTLYARIGREHFTIAHEINTDIQTEIDRLLESTSEGLKNVIYLRDLLGRDVTFYSPDYAVSIDGDEITLGTAFTAGSYRATAVEADATSDASTLDIAFTDGLVHRPVVSGGTLTDDVSTLSIAFTDGEYS